MNLAHIIDGHPPDHVAIISRGVETTYRQLGDDVAKVRGGLTKLGVGTGDRVALLCGNGLYFVEA
ncbi:MAG: AMP-binding protein, partial [Ilumatobacteraceae bacterium]|nr:AMP-binding protein [Ilumatobacteraceae bacterium]